MPEKPIPQAEYPEIMRLLETEDFGKVNRDFALAYETLEKISKSKGLGKAAEARKAMKAIERVMDLLRDLLRTKYQAIEKGGQSTPRGKK